METNSHLIRGLPPHHNEEYQNKRNSSLRLVWGFTLLELMISITILVLLAVIGSIALGNYRSFQALEVDAREIVVRLRDAQQRSITQDEGMRWGIRFFDDSSGDIYEVFKGDSFQGGTLVRSLDLDPLIGYNRFEPVGFILELVFDPVTGAAVVLDPVSGMPLLPLGGSALVELRIEGSNCGASPSHCKIITIQPNGTISYSS